MTGDEKMNRALRRHQNGEPAQTDVIYRQAVHEQPDGVGASHFLGAIAYQNGKLHVAAFSCSRKSPR